MEWSLSHYPWKNLKDNSEGKDMAAGMPDYQSIVRPRYGGALSTYGYLTMASGGSTLLAEVFGRGMIYGGYVLVNYTSSQKDSLVYFYADNSLLVYDDFASLAEFGLALPGTYPLSIVKFDDVEFKYCVLFSYGITFETGFRLAYGERHLATPKVKFRLVYALL